MLSILRGYKKNLRNLRDEFNYRTKSGKWPLTDKILMYHGIDQCNSLDHNFRHIGVTYFEKHLKCLKKHFNVVSLEDFFKDIHHGSKPNCAITFDDGYLNNLKYGLPLLEKYECPATIFATTIHEANVDFLWSDMLDLMIPLLPNRFRYKGIEYFKNQTKWYQPYASAEGKNLHSTIKEMSFQDKLAFFASFQNLVDDIKSNEKLTDYWKLMNETELASLSQSSIISIGSHAMTHSNIGFLEKKEAELELKNSKFILEKITNQPIDALAYPDGSYTPRDIECATSLGYKYQLAVQYLSKNDMNNRHILSRTGLYAYQTLKEQYSTILT